MAHYNVPINLPLILIRNNLHVADPGFKKRGEGVGGGGWGQGGIILKKL